MALSKNEKNKREAAKLSRKLDRKKNKTGLFARLFMGKTTYDVLKEDRLQSPWRTVVRNFAANKVSLTALLIFLLIFAFVIIAPRYFPLDLSYQETSQMNIAPGLNMLDIPEGLTGNVLSISVGPKFSVGVSHDGEIFVWGHPDITQTISLNDIPEYEGKAVMVAAGTDHIAMLTDRNEVLVWGNTRNKQGDIPKDIGDHGNIVQLISGYQVSAALTDQGYAFAWGNMNLNDIRIRKDVQGTLKKLTLTSDAMVGLTVDGNVVYLGAQTTSYSQIPDTLMDGDVVDIAASGLSVAAVDTAGKATVWGILNPGWSHATENLASIPEHEGKLVQIDAGRYHYVGFTDSGDIFAWGSNIYGQTNVPDRIDASQIRDIYCGYYQNYAVMQSGETVAWGHKGYVLGTDGLGRDNLNRLVNGGRMTMSVGAVSVVIAMIIGVLIGCLSGFFGGKVDMILMRLTEIASSIPFIPFAMILSTVLVSMMGEDMRIVVIMVILGLLSWTGLARLIRAQVLSQREQEYVTAAKAMGIREGTIVFKHILPNVISTIIVNGTLSFATCLLTEASLSYLGFGVSLPRPTWGNMLFGANNSIVIQQYWWQWVFPALILSVCVICINTIGDGLRDAIDPKSNER